MKRSEPGCIALFTFCAIFFFAHGDISAQGRESISQNPLGPFTTSVERRRAEQDLRALPLKLSERRERNLSDPKILEQMNEDFVRIQVIRAGMVEKFRAGKLIDPSDLEDLAAEIKRRAARLRSMLALSEEPEFDEPKAQKARTLESLNDRAFQLCIEISRFTENPIFKPKGTITARHSGEADKNLGLVVALAGSIQKDAAGYRKK